MIRRAYSRYSERRAPNRDEDDIQRQIERKARKRATAAADSLAVTDGHSCVTNPLFRARVPWN
jgi:hypothetical protein